MRDVGYRKGPSRTKDEEAPLGVFFLFEASQPSGRRYRLAIGCFVPPNLASLVLLMMRLI